MVSVFNSLGINNPFCRSIVANAVALSCLMPIWSWAAVEDNADEKELNQAFGSDVLVSVATGTKQLLRRAPAVTTVISAEDIAAMGARSLDDVLEAVPGLHIARSSQGYSPIYVIRGVNLGFNPQVLILENGIPLTKVFAGNRGQLWSEYPVQHISKIEVLRGPGSAVHGADAVVGVINIITKSPQELATLQLGLETGSFSSHQGWLQSSGSVGPFQYAAFLKKGSTKGDRSLIEEDAQTGFDALTGTHASLAPGPLNNGRESLDGAFSLSHGHWMWRIGVRRLDDVGSAQGIASALDPRGSSRNAFINSDLTYHHDAIAPNWNLEFQASAMDYREQSDLFLFPAGANLGGLYTDGFIGNPHKWERNARMAASVTYTGARNHQLHIGIGSKWNDLYKIRETRNASSNFTPIGTGSIADVIDVSETSPFIRPHSRQVHHVFGQDEWSLMPDWTLTAGLRHDRYSDFGHTTNPRLALVWDASYNLTAKLMAGTAFRPPSFTEMFAVNNPVVTGNPNLRPEKTRTLEAAFTWQASPTWQMGANIYRFHMDDIIQLVSFVYQNTGKLTGQGLELETAWTPHAQLRFTGNYSYQHTVDGATQHDAGNAPHHQVYARIDWKLPRDWSIHTQMNWISKQTRVLADTRPALAGYNTVDITIRTPDQFQGWQGTVSVKNLFDAEVREPSAYDYTPARPFISLPNDYPMPGRSVYVQGTYRF